METYVFVPPPEPKYRENPDLPSGTIKQVDWAAQGSDVTVSRTVTRNGAVIPQETFCTRYKAWGEACEYGHGTKLPADTTEPEEKRPVHPNGIACEKKVPCPPFFLTFCVCFYL